MPYRTRRRAARREKAAHLADARDHHRIVQRRQRIQCLHLRKNFIGNQRPFSEFLAAMNNAMGYNADFAGAADDAGFLRGEFAGHCFECFPEIGLRQGRALPPFGP